MKKYKDLSNQTGIIMYEIGSNSITLVFKKDDFDKGILYHYSTQLMSKTHINMMCNFAEKGLGLRTFLHSKETRDFIRYDYKRDLNI